MPPSQEIPEWFEWPRGVKHIFANDLHIIYTRTQYSTLLFKIGLITSSFRI